MVPTKYNFPNATIMKDLKDLKDTLNHLFFIIKRSIIVYFIKTTSYQYDDITI